MISTQASFLPDGACRLLDHPAPGKEVVFTWVSVSTWAKDWLTEWRTEDYAEASDFISTACDDAVPGVVRALVVLAEAADGDAGLIGCIGAGPLEDLLSHSGNGLRVVEDLAEAVRRHPPLHEALHSTILPPNVEAKLTELGVQIRRPRR